MVSKEDLVSHCITTGVPASKTNVDNITEFYKTISIPGTNEAFFARAVILVEGDTEQLSLPIYLEALGFDCDLYGVSIIQVGGKNQLPKYWRLLSKFNAPVIVIFDRDDGNNDGLARCFGVDVQEINHHETSYRRLSSNTDPQTALYVLNRDFETAIKADLNDQAIYDKYETEAKALLKPEGDQCKGQIARYVARKLATEGKKISFITDLNNLLNELLGIKKPEDPQEIDPLS